VVWSQTNSAPYTASSLVGAWVLSLVCSSWDVKFTACLHIVPKLRMSGTVPLCPHVGIHGMDRGKFSFYLIIEHF